MFKLNLKLYFKNMVLTIITIVSWLFCIGYLSYWSVNAMQVKSYYQNKFVDSLQDIQLLSWFCMVFFLFVGYEYFVQSKNCFTLETLKSTLKGNNFSQKYQFLVMETMIGVLFLVSLAYVYVTVMLFGGLNLPYAVHIFLDVFLNIFLLSNVGLFMGMAITVSKKRLTAYIIMVIFAVVTGPFGEEVYRMLTNYTGINLYKIANLFFICPPNSGYVVDYSFVSSILPYRFFAVMFWVFLALLFVIIPMIYEKKNKVKHRAVSLVLLLLVVACGVGVLMPQSKGIRNSDPEQFNHADSLYYREKYAGGEIIFPNVGEQPFSISSYDMEFSALFDLSASVTMTVDKSNLNNYCFTLYHGYKLKSVKDQAGNSMEFVQDKDFITVKNNGKTVEKITMKYSGYSPSLYSNVQGLNLPGDFAYYPRAGFKELYSSQSGLLSTFVDNNTEFKISFKYGKEIFSNLESNGKNNFYGKSNGVTLVSGFYEERIVDGFTIALPYLDGYNSDKELFEKSIVQLKSFSENIEDIEDENPEFVSKYGIKNKKIIFTTFASQGGTGMSLFQDHITTPGGIYELSKRMQDKIMKSEAIENVES